MVLVETKNSMINPAIMPSQKQHECYRHLKTCSCFTHFPWDNTQLFCRQVVKLKDEPPVEIAVTIQWSVMDVSLLLLVVHSWHPSRKFEIQISYFFQHLIKRGLKMNSVPFNIDITHVFSSDACFIQSDISCVPDNGSQEVPVLNVSLCFILKCTIMK